MCSWFFCRIIGVDIFILLYCSLQMGSDPNGLLAAQGGDGRIDGDVGRQLLFDGHRPQPAAKKPIDNLWTFEWPNLFWRISWFRICAIPSENDARIFYELKMIPFGANQWRVKKISWTIKNSKPQKSKKYVSINNWYKFSPMTNQLNRGILFD